MKLARQIDSEPWFIFLRWLLVFPVAWIGFYLGFLVAVLTYQVLTGWCPGGKIVSGTCSIDWVNHIPFIVGAAIAPGLVLIFGTVMAPSHRIAVTWTLYMMGALVSLFFIRVPGAVATAGITGALVSVLLHRKFLASDKSAHNHSLDRPAAR
jgi:hypothetical protein